MSFFFAVLFLFNAMLSMLIAHDRRDDGEAEWMIFWMLLALVEVTCCLALIKYQ